MDTDGSLSFKSKDGRPHDYPVIKISMASKNLISQVHKLLKNMGFKAYLNLDERVYDKRFDMFDVKSTLYLNGKTNLIKWVEKIGFSNEKHMTRYRVWELTGICPPKTTLIKRKSILNGESFSYNYAPVAQFG